MPDTRSPLQCVVLAGGLGTRMHPVTESLPKALIPVAGEPFILHQLRWLASHGVSEVILAIGHLGELIEAEVGDGTRVGVPVRYVREGSTLRGTAGALRLALDEGVLAPEFLVTYGDSYLPVDFAAVFEAFRNAGRPALMTVFRNEGRWDTSNVIFDETTELVTLYDKHHPLGPAHEFQYIDYGLSVLSRDLIARRIPGDSHQKFDLAQVFHALSLSQELAGLLVAERFYEIGSFSGLKELEAYLARSS